MGSKYIEIYDLVQASPDEYFMHHGIKNQKWGVRRGPPYPLKSGSGTKTKKATKDHSQKNPSTSDSDVSKMSDAELRKRTDRLRLENNYKQEYRRSKELDSFYKRYGHRLSETAATADAVVRLGKLGIQFLKKAGKVLV